MEQLSWIQRYWMNGIMHRLHLRHHVPRFLKTCPEPFRGEVLEVGAGRGWTSRRILETFPQVELTATDVNADDTKAFGELLKQFGRRLKVREANVHKLPFDRDTFDIVTAINVMSHLQPYAVKRALEELLRVVRPGGLVGISDHFLLFSAPSASRSSIEEVLKAEGCEISYARGGRYYDIWVRKPYPAQSKMSE